VRDGTSLTFKMQILLFTFLISLLSSSSPEYDSDSDVDNEQLRHALHKVSLQQLTGPTTIDDRDLKDSDTPFEKIHDDVYCADQPPNFEPPLSTTKVLNMGECKLKCIENVQCQYMAYWVKTHKCEIYFTCFTQVPDGKNRISVYKRVSPCEQRRDLYYEGMAKHFAKDVLRPLFMPFEWQTSMVPRSEYPNPNMICKCTGIVWMICSIFLIAKTEEFDIVNDRFDPSDLDKLKPFTVIENALHKYGGEPMLITYTERRGLPRVRAEMTLPEFTIAGNLQRVGCVHVDQCTLGTPGNKCPVEKRPFESGEPVYILKNDVLHGEDFNRPLVCVTARGLRSWMMKTETAIEMFLDPLMRTVSTELEPEVVHKKRFFKIPEDYVLFWTFDDAALETGICGKVGENTPGRPVVPPPPPRGPPASASSEAGPSQPEDSEDKAKRKKKKRGKSKQQQDESPDSGSLVAPGSLPLIEQQGETETLTRPASDTDLFNLGLSESLRLPLRPSSGSPLSEGSGPSSSERQKVVLSPRDVAQLRRSFEAAKIRRAQEKEDHVAESSDLQLDATLDGKVRANFHAINSEPKVVALLTLVMLSMLCTFFSYRQSSEANVYLEFSQQETF